MNEHRALLAETADKVFSGLDADFSAAWAAAEDAGLPWVMASEAAGGIGGGFEDACVILMAAGRHAVALPIGEAIVAAAMLAETGLAMEGTLTLAKRAEGDLKKDGDGFVFTGALRGVAYGDDAARIAAIVEQNGRAHVICAARADGEARERRTDPTDTPYDDLEFAGARVATTASDTWSAARVFHAMTLARACQMAGAIDAALKLSATHVNQRQQFGRPLAKFQAIQQQMAVLVEEGAAASAAAMAAARAADEGDGAFEIACAKLRANQAAGEAAGIAHQVHGAIGFTREYDLQRFTRRLWSWRSEYGNARHWADAIGARAAHAGADGFWPGLVSNFAG
jgi:acyl-CoA dehydrogenase